MRLSAPRRTPPSGYLLTDFGQVRLTFRLPPRGQAVGTVPRGALTDREILADGSERSAFDRRIRTRQLRGEQPACAP